MRDAFNVHTDSSDTDNHYDPASPTKSTDDNTNNDEDTSNIFLKDTQIILYDENKQDEDTINNTDSNKETQNTTDSNASVDSLLKTDEDKNTNTLTLTAVTLQTLPALLILRMTISRSEAH